MGNADTYYDKKMNMQPLRPRASESQGRKPQGRLGLLLNYTLHASENTIRKLRLMYSWTTAKVSDFQSSRGILVYTHTIADWLQ